MTVVVTDSKGNPVDIHSDVVVNLVKKYLETLIEASFPGVKVTLKRANKTEKTARPSN